MSFGAPALWMQGGFSIHSRGNKPPLMADVKLKMSLASVCTVIDVKSASPPSSEKHLQKLLKTPKNFSDELQMDCGIDKEESIRIVKGRLL